MLLFVKDEEGSVDALDPKDFVGFDTDMSRTIPQASRVGLFPNMLE